MPTIDVDYAELQKMLGIDLKRDPEKIDAVLAFAKGRSQTLRRKDGHDECRD